MNPLSPLTYYLRHKRSALLQMALISLATVGLFILVGVLDTLPMRANVNYLTKLSQVRPTTGVLDSATVSQIRTHPDVARVIPDNGLQIALPALFGTDSQRLLGVSPQDAGYLMQHCGARLKQGRMFQPRSNEFVLSEEIARALDLELGSEIGREIDQNYYRSIPAPLVLVGILEIASGPNVRLGFVSAEYLNSHELYAPRASSLLLVAKTGRKAALDDFLETTISSKYAEVQTFDLFVRTSEAARTLIYVVFGIVNSVAAIAVALVVGVINQIAMSKRLGEFGLLHALGRPKDDVPTEMIVVGILRPRTKHSHSGQTLSSDAMWLGLASYEYLESHELTSSRSVHLLIVPAGGRKDELDAWLESLASAQTNVTTYDIEYREHREFVQGLVLVFAVVGCVTSIVAAIAMATLNYIFFTQRQEEFGILHAVGRSRLWLVLRTMKETGSVITVAWLAGAVICCIGLICFQTLVFAPKGLSLNFFNPAPWVLTFPIPLAFVVVGTGTIARMLSKLDPVSIIERR